MRKKIFIIASIVFFLIINLRYYLESIIGELMFPIFISQVLIFFVLVTIFTLLFFKSLNKKFKNKSENTALIISVVLWPAGIINFEKLESENIFIANREGAVNCMNTLKLKSDKKFKERSVCFGVTIISVEYEIKNDTIYFLNIKPVEKAEDYYKFAVVKKSTTTNQKVLMMFKTYNDTIPFELKIRKNEL